VLHSPTPGATVATKQSQPPLRDRLSKERRSAPRQDSPVPSRSVGKRGIGSRVSCRFARFSHQRRVLQGPAATSIRERQLLPRQGEAGVALWGEEGASELQREAQLEGVIHGSRAGGVFLPLPLEGDRPRFIHLSRPGVGRQRPPQAGDGVLRGECQAQ